MIAVLLTRVLCDFVPRELKLDAVHLMGQTTDNQESVIARAVELIKANRFDCLTMFKEKISGQPGGEIWEKEIRSRVGEVSIPIIQLSFPFIEGVKMSNTYGEAIALVSEAKSRGWKHVAIVAQPLHQLRSFTAFVTVIEKNLPDLKVYNIVGQSLDWSTHVVHSQGTLTGVRADLLQEEFARIARYQAMGYLAPQDTVLQYLNRRDGIQ